MGSGVTGSAVVSPCLESVSQSGEGEPGCKRFTLRGSTVHTDLHTQLSLITEGFSVFSESPFHHGRQKEPDQVRNTSTDGSFRSNFGFVSSAIRIFRCFFSKRASLFSQFVWLELETSAAMAAFSSQNTEIRLGPFQTKRYIFSTRYVWDIFVLVQVLEMDRFDVQFHAVHRADVFSSLANVSCRASGRKS